MLGMVRIFRTRLKSSEAVPFTGVHSFLSTHHIMCNITTQNRCFPTDLNMPPPLLLLRESLALWGPERTCHPAVPGPNAFKYSQDMLGCVSAGTAHIHQGLIWFGVKDEGQIGGQRAFCRPLSWLPIRLRVEETTGFLVNFAFFWWWDNKPVCFFEIFPFEIISLSQKSYKKYIQNSYSCYQCVTFCHICFPHPISFSVSVSARLSNACICVCLSKPFENRLCTSCTFIT